MAEESASWFPTLGWHQGQQADIAAPFLAEIRAKLGSGPRRRSKRLPELKRGYRSSEEVAAFEALQAQRLREAMEVIQRELGALGAESAVTDEIPF